MDSSLRPDSATVAATVADAPRLVGDGGRSVSGLPRRWPICPRLA